MALPDEVLAELAAEGFQFKVGGPATYVRLVALRDISAAAD